MTLKNRLIEVVIIVFGTALIVFMVRSCPETIQAVSETIEEPNEPLPIDYTCDCGQQIYLGGYYSLDDIYNCGGCGQALKITDGNFVVADPNEQAPAASGRK